MNCFSDSFRRFSNGFMPQDWGRDRFADFWGLYREHNHNVVEGACASSLMGSKHAKSVKAAEDSVCPKPLLAEDSFITLGKQTLNT